MVCVGGAVTSVWTSKSTDVNEFGLVGDEGRKKGWSFGERSSFVEAWVVSSHEPSGG